ncbi:GAP family protein [Allostreptomyces psammosilenae]|uniref:Uncharacterized protein n=1 Tax=Allostreptomyces psammosilenae TaxID=1892865 RepID=A0A853A9V3_9ACTN|nr:GAP family protein [Allostreptomyces psammosilenae]NYI07172.1 hypothetical protein [Allostreptomyces psammosilenae]
MAFRRLGWIAVLADVLPLAVTMMLGPQIVAAIVLATSPRAVRGSVAFLAGVVLATVVGVLVGRGLAALLGGAVRLGSPSDGGSLGRVIQLVLVAALVVAAVRTYRGRDTATPPRWLTGLMGAGPGRAFRTGLTVILLMPSDVLIMLTVGVDLELHHAGPGAAWPFLTATALVAALPLLALLALGQRATRRLPGVRNWLESHSWLVTVALCLVFAAVVLTR